MIHSERPGRCLHRTIANNLKKNPDVAPFHKVLRSSTTHDAAPADASSMLNCRPDCGAASFDTAETAVYYDPSKSNEVNCSKGEPKIPGERRSQLAEQKRGRGLVPGMDGGILQRQGVHILDASMPG
jgi:hypothetical protein